MTVNHPERSDQTDLDRYWAERTRKLTAGCEEGDAAHAEHGSVVHTADADTSRFAGHDSLRSSNQLPRHEDSSTTRLKLTYEEFIRRRQAGTVSAGIDRSTALRLIDRFPKRYQAAHTFWSWICVLSVPAFIAISVFWVWWAGLLLLFVVTPILFGAIKDSAAKFVVEHAEENKAFFEQLLEADVIVFREGSPLE